MKPLRALKRWFFRDFMTMTLQALVLCEAGLVLWATLQWTALPRWLCLTITIALWFGLNRVQPGFTWQLRRRHFASAAGRAAVRVYFAWCLACMVAALGLLLVTVPYAVGWPVAQVVSGAAATWWASAFHIVSAAAVATAWCLVVYGSSIGQAFLRRPHATVPIPHLPAALRGLRVVHVSDLHLGHHLHGAHLDRYVREINALAPDLVVLTGDIVDHDPAWIARTFPSLARLGARHGVFVVLGNHDRYTGEEAVADGLRRHTDFHVLRDEWTPVTVADATLYLIGLDDPSTHFGQWAWAEFPLEAVIRDLPDDGPAILLCHRPDVWPRAVAAGIPLTLAGHTHGGQLAVPGSRRLSLASLITRYPSGWFEEDDCRLYVSRGLGVAGSPIRIGAPREIAIHELQPAPHYRPAPETVLQPAEAPVDS